MIKTKKSRKKKKSLGKLIKNKKAKILISSIILLTLIILISYFSIDYISGWTFTDRSFDNSSVTQGNYQGKLETLKFNDPYRAGYCFADISFHRSYTEGTFSFYVRIDDKSQLNLQIEFIGINGIYSRWENIQNHLEKEYQWYKIDYVYDCPKNSFEIYLDNILIETNLTSFITTENFNQVFIKTNDDGIAELYINIIKIE